MKNYTKPRPIEYRVEWDKERAQFAVYRQTERTPHSSSVRNVSVALAIQEANMEAARSGEKVIVTSIRDGKRIIEWEFNARVVSGLSNRPMMLRAEPPRVIGALHRRAGKLRI